MADLLYLSYWLKGFNEGGMLGQWARALRLFPFSAASGGVTTLRIYAVEYAEPALLELFYDVPPEIEDLMRSAAEFQGGDCAYLAGGYWDLWQHDGGWRLAPAPVLLGCYGPRFEHDVGDHLRIELGLDSHFLPQPGVAGSVPKVQSNIRSVLRLARELDRALPVKSRCLWTESGEDFSVRLQSLLA